MSDDGGTAAHAASEQASSRDAIRPGGSIGVLNAALSDALSTVGFGLSGLYVAFAIGHALILPPTVRIPMVVAAVVTALAYATIGLAGRAGRIPTQQAHVVAATMLALLAANSLLHLSLAQEIKHSTNVGLIVVGAGCFLLSLRWWSGVVAATLLAWALVVIQWVPDPDWVHYGFMQGICVTLSGLVFGTRRRNVLKADRSRARSEVRRSELAQALADNESLRRDRELILRFAGEGICGLDPDGRIDFANPTAAKMLGVSKDEMLGRAVHEVTGLANLEGEAFSDETCPIRAALQEGVPGSSDDELFSVKGMAFPVEYTVTPIVEDGATTGGVIIFRDVSERKQIEEELRRMTMRDPLTGLANRRALDEASKREWRRAGRAKGPIAVVVIDVDFFKQFNDLYGHQRGDECLFQVAALLSECAQRPADLAVRYGGEEFALLLPETDSPGATCVAKRFQELLAGAAIPHEGSKVGESVTASVGVVSSLPASGTTFDEAFALADEALYDAKREGRNRIVTRAMADDRVA